MDVQQILSRLERNEGYFPKAAIREAIAHRSEIILPLLEVLETVARDPQSFASDPKRMTHIYAMYLLAQFRGTRAYPLLVQAFSSCRPVGALSPSLMRPRGACESAVPTP